jgi:predicted dinucleotide-binding enzyme
MPSNQQQESLQGGTLALIGAGRIGSAVGQLAVGAGLEVTVTDAVPGAAETLAAKLGSRARALAVQDAVASADWILAAIPMHSYRQLPADLLTGKIVVATLNYIPQFDGPLDELESRDITSSELVQEHLAGVYVVKAFNNISAVHIVELARPAGAPDRSALPVGSDHSHATAATVRLLDLLGYDAVDAGTLADSWRYQPPMPAFVAPYALDPAALTSNDAYTPGVRVDAETLRVALNAAVPTTIETH